MPETGSRNEIRQPHFAPDQCPVCETPGAPERFRRDGGGTYYQCGECGLVFIANNTPENPYPVNALSQKQWSSGFLGDFRSNKLWNYSISHVAWITSYLEHFSLPRPPRALSIGCAYAHDLRELSRRGWEVLGVDHDAGFAKRARNQHGIEVRSDFFERADVSGEWDLVILASVLPYMYDLNAVMERVRKLVRPGGFMFITVRNIDWHDVTEILAYPMNVHARQYFPADSLKGLAHRYDFSPVALDCFNFRQPLAARLAGKLSPGSAKNLATKAANLQYLAWNAMGRDSFTPVPACRGKQVRFLARRNG